LTKITYRVILFTSIKKEDIMDYTSLWIAFAAVFIGLPIVGSIAIHWRPNDK